MSGDKRMNIEDAIENVHHEDLLVWHYCVDELPKKNGLYFVTWMHNDSGYICLKEFSDGRWKSTLNIIAWMPCPNPCTKKEMIKNEL